MASVFVYRGTLYMNIRVNGKQVKRSTGLENTRSNKLYIQQELLPKFIAEATSPVSMNVKLSYYIDKFLQEKKHTLKERTLYRYSSIISKWIYPKYGNVKVACIKVSMLKEYLNQQFSLGKSAKSVELYRTVFSGILQEAVYDGMLASNPFANIKRKKVKKPDITPFSASEVNKLLCATEGWLHNYIGMATHLGLRSGELLGLKWSDIDSKSISIQRTRDFSKDGTPKTCSSVRELPLFKSVKKFIHKQRLLTGDLEYVFVKTDKTPWSNTQWIAQGHWYPLLDRLGLKKRRLYEMRHTFATNMLNSGHYKVNDIARMMGHTTTEYLFNVYSRYIKSEQNAIPLDVNVYE